MTSVEKSTSRKNLLRWSGHKHNGVGERGFAFIKKLSEASIFQAGVVQRLSIARFCLAVGESKNNACDVLNRTADAHAKLV